MEKLRDDTLADIAKKKRAYSNEIASMAEELQMLRDIYNGKRPETDYEGDYYVIRIPMIVIGNDTPEPMVQAILDDATGKPWYVVHASYPRRRYIMLRVR